MRFNTKVNAVDSCILLRCIERDIPEQFERIAKMLLNGHDFYVDDVAIMETVHVLTKAGRSRKVIANNIRDLLRNPVFVWDGEFFLPVFRDYVEHPSLSFDDLVLAGRTEQKGYAVLWTLDKKLASQCEVARLV